MTLTEIDAAIAALESAQDRPLREMKLHEGSASSDDEARRIVIAAYDRLKSLDQQIVGLRTARAAEAQRLADLAAAEVLTDLDSTAT